MLKIWNKAICIDNRAFCIDKHTSFTTNQTITVNGTVAEGTGPLLAIYVELKDPRNETLLYESVNMTTGSFDTPFSYRLVAGDLERNGGVTRTVFKPMNETGEN